MRKDPFSFSIRVCVSLPVIVKAQVEEIDRESFAWAYHQTPKEREIGKDKFCSSVDRIGYVIAQQGNEIVGAVEYFQRTILFRKTPIVLGGIGGLCTRKDQRKRGVGTLLLNKAMEELQKGHVDIAYLCTEVEKEWMVAFYEKAGFVRLTHGHTYTGKSGKRYTEFDGMITPVCTRELFQRIVESNHVFDIGRGNW
ncbi:GNAT family N-acetyltransferase [Candidatus Gottesmanbacteria bacterium]|nr:GNAT family N-acetyltransferase [Candidatus Gottesmanbacteria bacterium]